MNLGPSAYEFHERRIASCCRVPWSCFHRRIDWIRSYLTSVDGVTWSRVPHDESIFGGACAESVTNGGRGLVAVGDADRRAVVWTSSDGIAWSRVPHDEAIFGGEPVTRMRPVTAGGPGLVAAGREGWNEQGPAGNVAIWTSVDGSPGPGFPTTKQPLVDRASRAWQRWVPAW